MRILWLSPTPSLYDEKKYGGWVASLERIFKEYLFNIELGIVFESENVESTSRDNVNYFPIRKWISQRDELRFKFGKKISYDKYLLQIINIIKRFNPDIIQCFGSEYPYGLISKYVDIPVIIHMQGFLNVYNMSSEMAFNSFDTFSYHLLSPKSIYHTIYDKKVHNRSNQVERDVMRSNHYFMGRTQWDRYIVKYYSPYSKYYYCPEALRPAIYNSSEHWKWNDVRTPNLITITQAGTLKGNEIILRTAELLKNQFHFNFVWKVAGNKDSFLKFEHKTGIKHEEVNIELLGMISADQIVEELCNARLYVHPAIIDNSPNSLCEAQVIGCPVLATYVGGIPDLVNNGKTGFLYPYNEPQTLAFKIMELVGDKELLSSVSENEIEVAKKRHNPSKIASRILEIYQAIINDYQNIK